MPPGLPYICKSCSKEMWSLLAVVEDWRGDFYPDRPIVGLVGQLTPRPIDVARLRERLLGLPTWSHDALFATPRGLLMLYAGHLTSVADLFATAPLNTDDRPLIEFLAPRLTRMSTTGDKDWFTGEALAAFYDALEARLMGAPDPLLPLSDEVAAARRAGIALYHYALATARHDDLTAARLPRSPAWPAVCSALANASSKRPR